MSLPFREIGNVVEGMAKKNFFHKAIDQKDTSVDTINLFLIAITIIGLLLLIVPAIAIMIEVWFNHTITTDLSGMAAYITSVVALFTTGGITAAWSNWAHAKYTATNNKPQDNDEEFTELK